MNSVSTTRTKHAGRAGCAPHQTPPDQIFVLLDDCDATIGSPTSRLYTEFVKTLECRDAGEFDALLEAMQQAIETGLHAVGLFAYELGAQCHGIDLPLTDKPLAQILLFSRCDHLSATAVEVWLTQAAANGTRLDPDQAAAAGVADVMPEIDRAGFDDAIELIQTYIAAGDVYQVNYTYRLRFDTYGSVVALYNRLRQRQPVPFGALIALPYGQAVLSFSPELFVSHADGRLVARPMKGTAPASGDGKEDARRAALLASDEKNRAENLMIVDLLRNDFGRIAATGSVAVPSLFDVKAYGSVLQMTSTIHAQLRPGVTLPEVLSALFPCGSITGAPKRRSMQIVDEVEISPRGIYTGAIGWFDRSQCSSRIGNFALSVPIRTLLLEAVSEGGTRRGEMGLGAGIVHDSQAEAEYDECQLKASFLIDAPPGFDLFETLYATREDGYRHLALHLRRLQQSAGYFGFTHDAAAIHAALEQARLNLAPAIPHRVRLRLAFRGACTVHGTPLEALAPVVGMVVATDPVFLDRQLLRHKITLRTQYDQAVQAAQVQGAFDMLFQNSHGELTEGARSNLFLKLEGRWYTPPLDAGVLPGVMRSVLLADPKWAASERRMTLADLARAEKIILCNALRGPVEARIVERMIR
ncbi:MAG: aminodeoxychorismate synthase component I [Pseudomonadota bacterium]